MSTISVILPTYQPRQDVFCRTIEGLRTQTLSEKEWELIVVCNGSSTKQVESLTDLSWKKECTVIHEPVLGLTRARKKGIETANGSIIVFVDDDNVLDSSYLENARIFLEQHQEIGAVGGKSYPQFEKDPTPWLGKFHSLLALRDLGEETIISGLQGQITSYPDFAPIGAGMVLRRDLALSYVAALDQTDGDDVPDRVGTALSSGGDNDMILHCLKQQSEVAYLPSLSLKHIIPSSRMTMGYLARLNYSASRSWIKVLAKYDICPWKKLHPYQVFPRKVVSFFRYHAWKSFEAYIDWSGICGQYDGRAEL